MAISTGRLTSEDLTYDDLCRAREDGNRYELIEGTLHLMERPTTWHQSLLARLACALSPEGTQPRPGITLPGPIDVRLSAHSVVQPDVIVVLADRFGIVADALIEGAPSLVAEFVSPSSRGMDCRTKLALYAAHDVPEYWLVDPDNRRVLVHTSPAAGRYGNVREARESVRAATVPELSVDLADWFDPPPWLR